MVYLCSGSDSETLEWFKELADCVAIEFREPFDRLTPSIR